MVGMSMERGGFGNVARAEVCEFVGAGALAAGCAISGRALRALARRLRVCGQRVPARAGAVVVRDGGRTFQHGVAQEDLSPAAQERRQVLVISAGAEQREGGQRVLRRDSVDFEVPRGGRVHRVGARAGAACARAQCSGLGGVRACCAVGCAVHLHLEMYAGEVKMNYQPREQSLLFPPDPR